MKWKTPPIIKIYEALGCIADNRLEIENKNAKVYSSSRKKFYTIKHEPKLNSIMVNDNGSYYIGYLGYPAIAYLMKIGELNFSKEYSTALKRIHWKDLNVKYDKNKGVGIPEYDFDSVIKEIDLLIEKKGINITKFKDFLKQTLKQIKSKDLNLLGKKELPPKGY